jgi:mRNA interferase RelE/StbE
VAERPRRHQVQVLPTAQRSLLKLPAKIRVRVVDAIRSLQANPRPAACRKLAGNADFYRIRVADYRVLYEIRDRVLLVLVIKVGHRQEVYRW